MIKNLSDIFDDSLTGHIVDLERFSAHAQRDILAILYKLQRELETKLLRLDPASVSFSRLERFLVSINKTINAAYSDTAAAHALLVGEMAEMETGFVNAMFTKSIGVDVTQPILAKNILSRIAKNTLVEGAPSALWWKRQSRSMQAAFSDQVRMGFLAGETTEDIVRRVRGRATGKFIFLGGKKVREFSGGVIGTSTKEARALVRTSVQQIANEVRLQTYEQNHDVIKGYQAHVTFDSRTTPLCQSRSGAAWLVDGSPMPDTPTVESFPGSPPWHWNCRSSLLPVTYSWEELVERSGGTKKQKKIANKLDNNAPARTRQSMDGLVSNDRYPTYNDWLKDQSKKTQIKALGKTKRDLWLKHDLTPRELIDQTGRPLPITAIRDNL